MEYCMWLLRNMRKGNMYTWDDFQKIMWNEKKQDGKFPGGPVVRTQGFHCQGPRFHPWLGN